MDKGLREFMIFPFSTIVDLLLTVIFFPFNWLLVLVDEPRLY